MKPIKICEANRDAIESALSDVNERATTFVLTSLEDVKDAVEKVEAKLSGILPKAAHRGAGASFTGAGPGSSSYRNQAITTCIDIERRASGFFLTGVKRASVFPKTKARVEVRLPALLREASKIYFERVLARNFCFVEDGDVSAHERLATLAAAKELMG